MDELPTEMLLKIFELLSYKDLMEVVLVSRRWRKLGETPKLWSSLPLIVNSKNMSLMPMILSSERRKELKRLRIDATLSKEVSQAIAEHPGLRILTLYTGEKKETLNSLFNVICSPGCQVSSLYVNFNTMCGVDGALLTEAVNKLETLEVRYTQLPKELAVGIFTALTEGGKLAKLYISGNNLSGIDPGLLVKTVNKLETLEMNDTKLTQEQTLRILTTVGEEGSMMTQLYISGHNLSGVDPDVLFKAVPKLKTLWASNTNLKQEQSVAILTSAVSENSRLIDLDIGTNNLSSVEPQLLFKLVHKLETLSIRNANLTADQTVALITAVCESCTLVHLHISRNNMSAVDHELLGKAVTKLESLEIGHAKLTQKQSVAVLSVANEKCKLSKLTINANDMNEVDPQLLFGAMSKLESFHV